MNPLFVSAHGARIPSIGLGTWQLTGDTGFEAVKAALVAGYRHLDTAAAYQNEVEVGAGLKASGLPRSEVWVTTKVWWDQIDDGPLQASAEASLKRLGLSEVDLLLIHWPNPEIPLARSIRALNAVWRSGLARHIGVSNFTLPLLAEAVRLSEAPLVVNQCEYHPRLDQSKLIAACAANGMAFVGYTPLGRGSLMDDPVISAIARAKGVTSGQVILRWHVQQGTVAIPRSSNPARIAENINLWHFSLDAAEMAAITALRAPDGRVVKPAFAPQWDAA